MRTTITIIAAASALALAACNGPTKAGQEAREAARQRMAKTSSMIVYDQAKQHFETGDFKKALEQANEAIRRSPSEPRYWILSGRILLETGKLEDALRAFEQAAKVAPDFAEAHYCMGIVHERWARDEDAIISYGKASELDQTKVSYLLACAEMLVANRRYDDARTKLEARLDYFENSAPMHQLLAQVAMLQDEPVRAVEHYNRALLIDPKTPMGLDDLVRAQFAAKRFEDCLMNVRRAQRECEGGKTADRLRVEGRCLAMLDRYGDARIAFAELTRLTPNDVQAWVDLASTAWHSGEMSRVRIAATTLLRLAPERYEGYVFQGLCEEEKGNVDSARSWFEKAQRIGGADPELTGHLLSTAEAAAEARAAASTSE